MTPAELNRLPTKELCQRINDAHWVAYYRPRKHTVSINGFPALPEKQAREQMITMLTRKDNTP